MRLPGLRTRTGLRAMAAVLGACDDAVPTSRPVSSWSAPTAGCRARHASPRPGRPTYYVRRRGHSQCPDRDLHRELGQPLSSKQLLRVVPDRSPCGTRRRRGKGW
jgi:hypothetical protein